MDALPSSPNPRACWSIVPADGISSEICTPPRGRLPPLSGNLQAQKKSVCALLSCQRSKGRKSEVCVLLTVRVLMGSKKQDNNKHKHTNIFRRPSPRDEHTRPRTNGTKWRTNGVSSRERANCASCPQNGSHLSRTPSGPICYLHRFLGPNQAFFWEAHLRALGHVALHMLEITIVQSLHGLQGATNLRQIEAMLHRNATLKDHLPKLLH